MRRIVVVVLLAASLAGAVAHAGADDDPGWGRLLGAYLRNPSRARGALMRAAQAGLATLPTPVVLAVADAEMRREHYRSARELCAAVRARDPGEPWIGWATLADAWAAIQLDRAEDAASLLRPVADGAGPSNMLAAFLLALVDGTRGAFDASEAGFERVRASGASEELRIAALFGLGLARYWRADFERAGGAFRTLVAEHTASPLADDARYGSALSELGLGHREEALRLLRDLAKERRDGSAARHQSDLAELAPGAVLRAAFDRYRRSAARQPEAQVAAALDGDGTGLARAMLARLAADDTRDARRADPPGATAIDPRDDASPPARATVARADARRERAYNPDAADAGGSWRVWLAAAVAFALGAGLTVRYGGRRAPDPRRRAMPSTRTSTTRAADQPTTRPPSTSRR